MSNIKKPRLTYVRNSKETCTITLNDYDSRIGKWSQYEYVFDFIGFNLVLNKYSVTETDIEYSRGIPALSTIQESQVFLPEEVKIFTKENFFKNVSVCTWSNRQRKAF
jgi:hypothetical protein